MGNISRRDFIKRVVVVGAGAAVLPGAFVPMANGSFEAIKESSLLLNFPCLAKPGSSTITVNIVAGEKPLDCFIKFREESGQKETPWQQTETFSVEANTPVDIPLKSLNTDAVYSYHALARLKGSEAFESVAENSFRTKRTGASPFSFAVISDPHITQKEPDRLRILSEVSASILARRPDFMLMLGDNIQTFTSHGGPMTEEGFGPMLYALLREGLGRLTASVPVFNVIGNWEGENGWHPEKERTWARKARMAWIPNPLPDTYPEGGNEFGDYYGFTWGDTLNLVLTVTGYTPTDHVYRSIIGKADDWTLGDRQKEWLYKRLSNSEAKWKFLFLHHTVGGKAGSDIDTRYGRGGGQAAHIGEQQLIHQWMQQFGVKALFYGHDHVFTDNPVDGIHYICAGSAGAPWKFPKSNTGYEKYWPDSGYTWVDVYSDKLTVSFIKPDTLKPEGEVLHQFEMS
jgi:3',5'-cyclic AMP phosphodiesterase CpdA